MRGPRTAAGVATLLAAAGCAGVFATAASAAPKTAARSDVREIPAGKTYSTDKLGTVGARSRARARSFSAAETPPVGTVRQWIALDDAQGRLYRKDYTLRGVGDHIEV